MNKQRLWNQNEIEPVGAGYQYNQAIQTNGYIKPSLDGNGYFDPRVASILK